MQRALDKTETMKARAEAVDELQAAGTFQDLTALGSGQDDIDRQLDQLGTKSVVDDEFARLKAEVQSGASQSALPAGDTGRAGDTGTAGDTGRAGDTGTAGDAEAQPQAAGDDEGRPPV
jgi:phage shock protein A